MDIFLDKVNENEKETLYRLLQYSLFEESLTDGNEMNNEAIFEYKYFEKYFEDSNRDAFFIREKQSNKLLGFVMINTYTEKLDEGHSIAEFMVIPKYRKNKIGKQAAEKCFNLYKGNWEVSPSLGSESAYNFWKKVVEEYTKGEYNFSDRTFIFSNK